MADDSTPARPSYRVLAIALIVVSAMLVVVSLAAL